MALVISDRIKETTNTVGTQTYQLEGAVTGFETFASNLSNGDTTYYAVTDNTNFEVGLGTINEGTSQTINYTVTVANVGGINVFVLNGVNNPVITFVKGFTYVFDVSDNTNGSHPLRFRTSADASYTDGVSVSGTQGQAGATVTIVVASDAPSTLKYYCTIHGNAMGNTINVISAVATLARTTILASSNSNNAVSFGTGAKTIFCTLPADKAVIKDASDDINIADNDKINLGTGSDLFIQHTGTNANIINSTGNFIIADTSGDVKIQGKYGEQSIIANNDGSVELYHDNSKKFETTSGGIEVTGTVTDDGATHDGDVTFTGTSGNIVFDKSDDALEFADSIKAVFGTNDDANIKHTGSVFQLVNGTGTMQISNNANDEDIVIRTDDGTGGVTTYFRADGSAGEVLLYHYGTEKFKTTSTGATVTGDVTISSTADGGPVLNLISNDHSDAADFNTEANIKFLADNSADEQTEYANIQLKTADVTDGTEDGWIYFANKSNGTINNTFAFSNEGGFYLLSTQTNHPVIQWNATGGTSFDIQLKTAVPTADRTITLPDATGTVLTTGNSDTPTTTTSSSDADFVLVDDGGTMKKITPSNLGITAGAASLDDATALAIALG